MSDLVKKIICLANSRKPHGRCIAGKEIKNNLVGSWIRPVSSRTDKEISIQECQSKNGRIPEVLDIIEIRFKEHSPTSFQIENYLINHTYYWEQAGHFGLENLPKLCDQPATLWQGGNSSYQGLNDRVSEDSTNRINSSLYLITPNTLKILVREEGREFGNPRRKVRADFSYRGIYYILPVTDPVIENSYLAKDDGTYVIQQPYNRIFMCISIGLPWDGYCYKFVASIIGLP
jgi:hypothetical protein